MHMRKKKWARPELDACPWFVPDPSAVCGHWAERFADPSLPLEVELGCGKGVSTAQMAADNPGTRYVALDVSPDVLGEARRNIVRAYGDRPVDNIVLTRADAAQAGSYFAPEDGVRRIHLSFSNPWPRPRHRKRRLTHPRQLMQYRTFLPVGGEIWFKTDDDPLFDDTLVYMELCGFDTAYLTRDLHASGFQPNYVSEHERMYTAQGVPIKFGIFRRNAEEIDFDPTRWKMEEEA